MCGISGEVRFDGGVADVAAVAAMCDQLSRRGPDGSGEWQAGPVALGHRRLKIIDLTDAGKLQGEIALGYYRVRRLIEDLPGFPSDAAAAVLHIILSHHGSLEHGSPVVPATREATLVHMMDNLGGKLGSFDRIERGLVEGQAWSGFDRGIDGSAYFRGRAA